MGQPEVALLLALGVLLGVTAGAVHLVCTLWGTHSPLPVPVRAGLVVVLLALALAITRSPVSEATRVAGVAAPEPTCGRGSAAPVHVVPRSERVALSSPTPLAPDCRVWAAVEDPRTGTLWLQGPATAGSTGWDLQLVVGAGFPDPLAYRVTVFAASADTSAAWLQLGAGSPLLTLGVLPPAQSWLATDIMVRPGS